MTDEVKLTDNAANAEYRSLCWLFFHETGEKNICKVCSEEINTTYRIESLLRNHLRRKHGNLWKICLETYLDDNNRRTDFPPNSDSKGVIAREIEKHLNTYSRISEVNKSTSGKSATVSKPTFEIESVQEVPMFIELSESPLFIASEVIIEEIDSPPATEMNPPPQTEINPPPQTEINPPPQAEINPPPQAEINPPPQAEIYPPPQAEITYPPPQAEIYPPPQAEIYPPPQAEIYPPPQAEIYPPPQAEIYPPPQAEIYPPPQTETAMELSNTVKLPNKQTKTSSIRKFTSNKKSHPMSSLHNRYKIPTTIPPNCLISGTSTDSGNLGQVCDNFGIYIASLLKNLPCRRKAHLLQSQIIDMILKERMSFFNQ
ncbi:hypothetical protein CEXT_527861 [Caerostris extrusa]|uniref:BED-type domain-containing protein n=1 Tax=Caerostris extrusa TaxID=172846 RepID=A0AAV4XRJ3_CAEEX|nr:hypothetical protein CEXT_527861 [Caerostris extrusa]